MNLQKFYSSSLIEAVNQMKEKLGDDAVIISTKKIENNELKSSSTLFEITAVESSTFQDDRNSKTVSNKNSTTSESYSPELNNDLIFEVKEKLKKTDIEDGIIKEIIDRLLMYGKFLTKENIDEFIVSIIASLLSLYELKDLGKQNRIILFGKSGAGKTTVVRKIMKQLATNEKRQIIYRNITESNDRFNIEDEKKLLPPNIFAEKMNLSEFMNHHKKNYSENFELIEFENDSLEKISSSLAEEIFHDSSLLLVEKINSAIISSDYREMLRMKLNYDGIILTNLDEITTHGGILNIVKKARKPIYYLSSGSGSEDDLLEAEPEITAKLIYTGSLYF